MTPVDADPFIAWSHSLRRQSLGWGQDTIRETIPTQISTGIWMRQFRSGNGLFYEGGSVGPRLARDYPCPILCLSFAMGLFLFSCSLGILESEDSATCETDQMSRRLASLSSGVGIRQHLPTECPEGRDARVGSFIKPEIQALDSLIALESNRGRVRTSRADNLASVVIPLRN